MGTTKQAGWKVSVCAERGCEQPVDHRVSKVRCPAHFHPSTHDRGGRVHPPTPAPPKYPDSHYQEGTT